MMKIGDKVKYKKQKKNTPFRNVRSKIRGEIIAVTSDDFVVVKFDDMENLHHILKEKLDISQ